MTLKNLTSLWSLFHLPVSRSKDRGGSTIELYEVIMVLHKDSRVCEFPTTAFSDASIHHSANILLSLSFQKTFYLYLYRFHCFVRVRVQIRLHLRWRVALFGHFGIVVFEGIGRMMGIDQMVAVFRGCGIVVLDDNLTWVCITQLISKTQPSVKNWYLV